MTIKTRKPILISGIQPTGRLHLGNYLGALKNFVELQNSKNYQCFFFIADLHAITENPEAKDLSLHTSNLMAHFLAIGLDPKKSVLFQQSRIRFLPELQWIFSTLAPVSELMRMTAFKEKVLQPLRPSEKEKITKEKLEEVIEKSNFALAEYPILMAADILIFNAAVVPVGEDQLQHLELARTLARVFNKKFGKTFVEPKPLLAATPRVMSLNDPLKKMSKSSPKGCLFLDDTPDIIKEKIRSAVTDSGNEIRYDIDKKPAISNLIAIYSAFSGLSITDVEKYFHNRKYFEFKTDLTELLVEKLAPIQKKYKTIRKNKQSLLAAFEKGSKRAEKIAQKKLEDVKKKIGFL